MKILIVSGLSGSGKSSAMDVLEDMGYYCVDNLPVSFFPKFITFCESESKIHQLALSLDSRSIGTIDEIVKIVSKLKSEKKKVDVVFTEAKSSVLIRRYSETRRPHPFAPNDPIEGAIKDEKKTLQPIKDISDIIIDSSTTNIHEFKKNIKKYISSSKETGSININVMSFGFKHGVPIESDLLLDVRFLPNPYFEKDLKEKTGLDKPVIKYLTNLKVTTSLLKKYFSLLNFLLLQYKKEGRSNLTISIGCTGGKHRSVFMAERIKKHLIKRYHLLNVTHRDITK